ncbi:hypothetical protein AB1Y20_002198 [Prymnesium parvum]|uniref:Glycosyltransferase 61 catalytic domain-containing protein n=1 Tax=Prymnesium parvum TaxID=97485 RepID=A0AB34J887_PRYPA
MPLLGVFLSALLPSESLDELFWQEYASTIRTGRWNSSRVPQLPSMLDSWAAGRRDHARAPPLTVLAPLPYRFEPATCAASGGTRFTARHRAARGDATLFLHHKFAAVPGVDYVQKLWDEALLVRVPRDARVVAVNDTTGETARLELPSGWNHSLCLDTHMGCHPGPGNRRLARLQQDPLPGCDQPACFYPGLTIVFNNMNPSFYHFMADFLAAILRVQLYERVPPNATRLLWAQSGFGSGEQLHNISQFMYFAGATTLPVLLLPQSGRLCARFEKLHVAHSVPPIVKKKHESKELLRDSLSAAFSLGDPARKLASTSAASPARITLLLRLGLSHGGLARRIQNAQEAVRAVDAAALSAYPVRVVAFDGVPPHRQLEIITQSDVYIGPHGAGMLNALFLPRCAVLLEMFAFGGCRSPVDKRITSPCPGAYASSHQPYVAWEDDQCPMNPKLWGLPNARRLCNGSLAVDGLSSQDGKSNLRDLHLNITRFVQYVRDAVKMRHDCITRKKAEATRSKPSGAQPSGAKPSFLSMATHFLKRVSNVLKSEGVRA